MGSKRQETPAVVGLQPTLVLPSQQYIVVCMVPSDPALYCFCTCVANRHLWQGWETPGKVQAQSCPLNHATSSGAAAEQNASPRPLWDLCSDSTNSSILFFVASQRSNALNGVVALQHTLHTFSMGSGFSKTQKVCIFAGNWLLAQTHKPSLS